MRRLPCLPKGRLQRCGLFRRYRCGKGRLEQLGWDLAIGESEALRVVPYGLKELETVGRLRREFQGKPPSIVGELSRSPVWRFCVVLGAGSPVQQSYVWSHSAAVAHTFGMEGNESARPGEEVARRPSRPHPGFSSGNGVDVAAAFLVRR